MKWTDQFSVKKLYDDLQYWIFIGIGDDIVDMPTNRIEYQHLVIRAIWDRKNSNIATPNLVLQYLKEETLEPWYKQRTFWVLVKLYILRVITWKF